MARDIKMAPRTREAPQRDAPDTGLALVCPFSNMSLTPVPGMLRFKGFGFHTKVFRDAAEVQRCLGVRDAKPEPVPATVYLRRCPWTGQVLEPQRDSHGWFWKGPFWRSQSFRKREHAHHWFSIRGGRKPVFGPDAVELAAGRPLTDGEEAARGAKEIIDGARQDAGERLGDGLS